MSVTLRGNLSKMMVSASQPVEYRLVLNQEPAQLLNDWLGFKIRIEIRGNINCIYCKRITGRSYSQGYCFLCSQELARCDLCIVNPHTCHYFKGTCREPAWAERNCLLPHKVYLAYTSGIKVGLSSYSNVVTRWIDQGATQGMGIANTATRLQAGKLEKLLSKYINDKTNWRKMLEGHSEHVDLKVFYNGILAKHLPEIKEFLSRESGACLIRLDELRIQHFTYPIIELPKSLTSLADQEVIEDTLIGIKGQYLMFTSGVLNIRKLSGYTVRITV